MEKRKKRDPALECLNIDLDQCIRWRDRLKRELITVEDKIKDLKWEIRAYEIQRSRKKQQANQLPSDEGYNNQEYYPADLRDEKKEN